MTSRKFIESNVLSLGLVMFCGAFGVQLSGCNDSDNPAPPTCPDSAEEANRITCSCGITYQDPDHKCYKPDAYNGGMENPQDPEADCALQPRINTLEVRDLSLNTPNGITISPTDELNVTWTYFNPMNAPIAVALNLGIEEPRLQVSSGFGNPLTYNEPAPWAQLQPCGEDEQDHDLGMLAAGSYTLQVVCPEINFSGMQSIPNFWIQ